MWQGCSSILRMDCVVLAQRLYREVRRARAPLYCLQQSARGADRDAATQPDMQWYARATPPPDHTPAGAEH